MKSFKINLYSGIFFRKDAISNSVLQKYEAIRSMGESLKLPLVCRIFTQGTDYDIPDTIVLRSAAYAAVHPAFHDADLHIFEFGIYYDLFNAILLKTDARKIVFYHNITPLALVNDDRARNAIGRSQTQLHNLVEANRIICISEFSRKELVERGFDPEQLSVIHLPPSIDIDGGRGRLTERTDGDRIRLLFVGRFTTAKGLADLVRAVAILKRRSLAHLRVDLVGTARFSEPGFIDALKALIASENVGEIVTIVGELSDDELALAYSRAQVFIMPSHHEGFCVPVLEAMGAGCFPVAYDAGNVPYLVAGWGLLAQTGDVAALASCLEDIVTRIDSARADNSELVLRTQRGVMPEGEWKAGILAHVAKYSRDAYVRHIRALLAQEIALAERSGIGTQAELLHR